MKFLKENKIIVVVIITIAAIWYLKSKNKTQSLAELWVNADTKPRVDKIEVGVTKRTVRIKRIKGYDVAILPNKEVLIYEPEANKWVPAVKSDLI